MLYLGSEGVLRMYSDRRLHATTSDQRERIMAASGDLGPRAADAAPVAGLGGGLVQGKCHADYL